MLLLLFNNNIIIKRRFIIFLQSEASCLEGCRLYVDEIRQPIGGMESEASCESSMWSRGKIRERRGGGRGREKRMVDKGLFLALAYAGFQPL